MKKLYYGGSVLTMDKACPRVEAVLTQDGKILAVGDLKDLETADAEKIDLKGAALMPGFVDGHSHMLGYGIHIMQNCDLFETTDFEDMCQRIMRYREKNNLTHGEPISCRGYDCAIMKEGAHPTAALLDSLGIDNPIRCIHISGHVMVYNTAAMKAAGVESATYVCPAGGYAGRDEDGNLNGIFEETAAGACGSLFAHEMSEQEMEDVVQIAQEEYVKNGYTTVQDGGGNGWGRINIIGKAAREGKLKLDVVFYTASKSADPSFWEKVLEEYGRDYRNHLKIGGVKIVLDGSPQAKTAWMLDPYEGETEYRGYPTLTDEELEERLDNAIKWNLQPLAHCNGSAACEQYVAAWEKAVAKNKDAMGLRPVMIHAQTVTYDQLDRMAKTGMMPSFFVGHCFFWGDTHMKNMGERGTRISPAKQALNRGIPFNLHQDSPVTPPDMLHSIWCAVNRITRNGVCVGEDNRIDCYDALIAATRGGAYSYFEEDTKGILKAGALADFVVLDQDPTAVDPMTIKDIKVLQTIKEDEVIYTA